MPNTSNADTGPAGIDAAGARESQRDGAANGHAPQVEPGHSGHDGVRRQNEQGTFDAERQSQRKTRRGKDAAVQGLERWTVQPAPTHSELGCLRDRERVPLEDERKRGGHEFSLGPTDRARFA